VTTFADESLLVLRAQYGDRDALELLLRSVHPSLLRYLRGLVGADDAPDLAQDVLVLVYRKLHALDNPEVFRHWAFRIATRTAFRHLRKRRSLPLNVGEDVLEHLTDSAPPTIDDAALVSMLNAVSPASRAVLALHFQEEMTLGEVAAVLEIPLGTVRSRLAYGLSMLRKRLADKGQQ
jgi:RNA polymerase sigma-70 factor, ECF subfamily